MMFLPYLCLCEKISSSTMKKVLKFLQGCRQGLVILSQLSCKHYRFIVTVTEPVLMQ